MVLQVSLRTLIGASPLLGSPQEDRSEIREAQDAELWQELREPASLPLAARHRTRFLVAPLDLVPVRQGGKLAFQLIELNGTGIGGLTNMPEPCIDATLAALSELAAVVLRVDGRAPVILVGISGRRTGDDPRANPLAYEKVLYADALARGFVRLGLAPTVCTIDAVVREVGIVGRWAPTRPSIVLGYSREFLPHLRAEHGRLWLCGAPVGGVVNDRLFQNICQSVGGALEPAQIVVMNRCHVVGADKGAAMTVLNEFLAVHGREFPALRPDHEFARVPDREALVAAVVGWLRERRAAVVVKPSGTGGGDGIEFFLDPDEPRDAVARRLLLSVERTERAYGVGVFPYTLCEYLEGATWPAVGHRFYGHRYELRVVVYRDGDILRAFPSIVKFACARYDATDVRRSMLLNNITAGAAHTGAPGARLMLPLCNRESLAAMGIAPAQLAELCRFGAAYVHAVLDRLDAAGAA